MVDSRQKGARAEAAVKKVLIDKTGLNWQRTPGSGALAPTHGLKGDLYIPNEKNFYCVEVKHYKDDHFTSKILTSKDPQLTEWWKQAVRQGIQTDKDPLLIFKFDRSKLFVAFEEEPCKMYKYRYSYYVHADMRFYIAKLEDWLKYEDVEFIK